MLYPYTNIVCQLFVLVLLFYTLWLVRSERLNSHIAVTWILVELLILLGFWLWKFSPFYVITSKLNDRELMMLLAVFIISLIIFLMLDILTKSSKHAHQIKCLTQEVALLRNEVDVRQIEGLQFKGLDEYEK